MDFERGRHWEQSDSYGDFWEAIKIRNARSLQELRASGELLDCVIELMDPNPGAGGFMGVRGLKKPSRHILRNYNTSVDCLIRMCRPDGIYFL
jgi:hypothetical protein